MATKAAKAKIVAAALLAIVDPTPTDLTILLSNALTPALNWSEGVLWFEQEKKKEYWACGLFDENERDAINGGWVKFQPPPVPA